jgi:allantoicase
MRTETETIKVIHVCDQGFDWRFVVKENPEFPEQAIVIQQHEEGNMKSEVSLPKCALKPLQEILDFFID